MTRTGQAGGIDRDHVDRRAEAVSAEARGHGALVELDPLDELESQRRSFGCETVYAHDGVSGSRSRSNETGSDGVVDDVVVPGTAELIVPEDHVRPHLTVSFRTRCLRGLLLAVQVAVSGLLTLAHAGDAAAIAVEVRIEDPRDSSGTPVHDETQCLTCRTLASAAHLTAPQRPVQPHRDTSRDSELPPLGRAHVARPFSAPLAARPPPLT